MTLLPDSREFIALLNSTNVEYVIIGGHAVAYYGVPRTTGDVDIVVRMSTENSMRIQKAIAEFGFGGLGIKPETFLEPDNVVQFGRPPNRIDILTSIDGVAFEELWRDRVRTKWEGVEVNLISREHLIANKRASGRPQDLADVAALEG